MVASGPSMSSSSSSSSLSPDSIDVGVCSIGEGPEGEGPPIDDVIGEGPDDVELTGIERFFSNSL